MIRVRELRAGEAPELFRFLTSYFPEEEAILGTRPEGFEKIVRRIFRWDTRILLGILRVFGRPVFRFFVVDDEGHVVGTTLLTFSAVTGYVSMVAIDPAYRRRGLARAMLDRALSATRRRGKRFIALDVLESNAPARALYERIGYRRLRANPIFVHDQPAAARGGPTAPVGAVPGLRPFERRDAKVLVEVAERQQPAGVHEVLPITARALTGSAWQGQLLASDRAAWVIDPGPGAVAWVSAAVSRATEAGHLSSPIVDTAVPPEAAAGLVRSAVAWCAERGVPRVMAEVPEENERGRRALEEVGFHRAISVLTLYRPVD